MTFRSKRGEGIKRLMELQKRNEGFGDDLDDFWKENKYFGKITEVTKGNEEDEDEDFNEEEFKDVKDVFDSDF